MACRWLKSLVLFQKRRNITNQVLFSGGENLLDLDGLYVA